MSTFNGAGVVTDGLVFAMDSANTARSWKGKPVTNTNSFGTYSYGYNSTKVSNATPPVAPPVQGYPIYKITSSDGNDSQQILYTANVDQVNGGVYTHSAYVYLESGTWVSCGQHWNPWDYGTAWYIPQGVWTRISYTVTNSANNYGNVALCYNTNGSVYVTGSQYETGSVASPLVNGTRSNTQAILDLTRNCTLTASSLTYNSNGTFSFNGSSDYVDVGKTCTDLGLSSYATFDIWIYPTSTNAMYGISDYGTNAIGMTLRTNGSTSADFYIYPNNYRITYNYAFNPNVWYNLTGVANGSTMYMYLNGQQVASTALGNGIGTSSNTLKIGGRGDVPTNVAYGTGQAGVVRIYNRALTSAEILQNFNATRSRYGV